MHYTAQLSLLQTPQVDVKFDEKPLAISSLSHKAGSELLLKQKTFHLKFKSFQCYYMSQELFFPLLSGKKNPTIFPASFTESQRQSIRFTGNFEQKQIHCGCKTKGAAKQGCVNSSGLSLERPCNSHHEELSSRQARTGAGTGVCVGGGEAGILVWLCRCSVRCFVVWDSVSLRSPGWPRAHYIAQAGSDFQRSTYLCLNASTLFGIYVNI